MLWERSLALGPDNIRQLVLLGDLYQRLGRTEDARRMVREMLRVDPGYTVESVRQLLGVFEGLGDPAANERAVANLRAAGLP